MNNILSLIIPVYRNEENIPDLLEALHHINSELEKNLEVVFVVDGSPDKSYEILQKSLKSVSFQSKLLLLTKNYGSFAAIRAGLEAGQGDRLGVMAADLQEPPELIIQMNSALQSEDIDVVIGVRDNRHDPFLTQLPSQIFWSLYRRFVINDIPPGGVDIFACSKIFRNQLLKLEEKHSSLIAQIFWMGYPRKFISYTRQKREHGKSAWTLSKKINYFMDSVFSFTDLPIRILMRGGAGITCFSGVLGTIIIISRLFGYILVPGYAATILAIIFFGSLNLFALGIIGSYSWRTYENTKNRPLHIVLRSQEFNMDKTKS